MCKHVVIIGGGFFGCAIANRLQYDYDVTIIEKNKQLLQGVAQNNVFRIHNGPHYPRSEETALQCIEGYRKFVPEFEHCINTSFPNIYAISSYGSNTSLEDLYAFCDRLEIPHSKLTASELPHFIHNCSGGIHCKEGTINVFRMREEYKKRLTEAEIIYCDEVTDIEQQGEQLLVVTNNLDLNADAVINCSFTNMNLASESLGFEPQQLVFQRTICFKTRIRGANLGLTILDGKFPTIFPSYWDETSESLDSFILYHVEHSVLCEEKALFRPSHRSFTQQELYRRYTATLREIEKYFPTLPERIEEVEYLLGDRIIRPRVRNSDTRVSEILNPCGNYFVVFNGKIDYSLSLADEMYVRLKNL